MTDYAAQIERVSHARSLDEIRSIVNQFSAKAVGEGGILYSGRVGDAHSHVIAKELAERTGLPIIDNTPRGQFLANADVDNAIRSSVEHIFKAEGKSTALAEKAKVDFLFGNPEAAIDSPTSVKNSLWGEASHEFASSLRGDIKVVASAANQNRVFGRVEIDAALHESQARTLGSRPIAELQSVFAQGQVKAILPEVQAQFVKASPHIFVAPGMPAGASVNSVALTRKFAESMGIDAPALRSEADLIATGYQRAPLGTAIRAAALNEMQLATQIAATRSPHSNLARGAGLLGAAATAYDATTTAARAAELREQGNPVGAQSEVMRFGARNVGGWGGALLGAGAGAAVTSSTGPGALIGGVVGGIAGAVGGDKFAAYLDQQRINTQTDRNGRVWHFDPRQEHAGWTRTVRELDVQAMTASTVDMPIYTPERTLGADPATAAELSYKASNTAVQLALADPPRPVDPYRIAADASDTPRSLRDSHWTRHPETGQWSRPVADGLIDRTMHTYIQPATPEKAAELDAYAQSVMAHNAERSPAAIAQRYEQAYARLGWAQFGPVPEAVTHAGTPAQEPTQIRTADSAPSEVRAQPPQAAAPDPGDQARSIATLQSGLIQLGYHRSISQPLAVNGVKDDATQQAVTAFQAKHDLPITSTFDHATQQALQQALLAQQQVAEQRQAEDKTREKDDAEKEQSRSEALLPYSDPTSPQHARRADLAQRAQAAGANLTEEQLTLGVAQMQARHIHPGWEGGVAVRDGILYVQQFMPPEQFVLDTRQPAPPVQETLQQAAIQQREHAEELARMEAMPKIHGPTLGPGNLGGLSSAQG